LLIAIKYKLVFRLQQFSNYNDELLTKLIHQETPHIIKCMKNAISISEDSLEASLEETLKILTTISKMASYYEISTIVKIALKYLRDNWKHFTNSRIDSVATDLAVTLLNHEDKNVYHIAYIECHVLVKSILGVKYNEDKLSWENLLFLLKPEVLTLIICDGATSKDTEVIKIACFSFMRAFSFICFLLFHIGRRTLYYIKLLCT